MLALSSGVQKWFWLGHRVKTAVSGKGNWAWHWLCHNQSNLSLTVVQSIQWAFSEVGSKRLKVSLPPVWHKWIAFTYALAVQKIRFVLLFLLASYRWKSFFTVHCEGFVESFILITCQLYPLTFKGERKKSSVIIRQNKVVIPNHILV